MVMTLFMRSSQSDKLKNLFCFSLLNTYRVFDYSSLFDLGGRGGENNFWAIAFFPWSVFIVDKNFFIHLTEQVGTTS